MDEYDKNYGGQAAMPMMSGKGLMPPSYNPTIRENLENRITELKKQISELERVKGLMPVDLIDMKISDLREAMRF